MRRRFTILILLTCVFNTYAIAGGDTIRLRKDDPVLMAIDSMEAIRYLSSDKFLVNRNKAKFPLPPDSVPRPDAATIAARIKKMDARTPMEMVYNDEVQAYINLYCVKARRVTSKLIGLTEIYFPLFEQMLDKYDMPLELKNLAIIESALNPKVKSPAGAMGLWQFMYPTGKMYGLEVNSYVDERCDPVKATEAACKYLKYLYSLYKDWNMALAAYNAGPGTINNAIRKSGGKTTYWEIYNFIPRETRGYVPAFIAANYFMTYYVEHNIVPYDTKKQFFAFDTVHINRRLDMRNVAAVLDINLEDLEYMNPVYKTNIIPGDDKKYHLYLPKTRIADFINNADSIYNYNKKPELAVSASAEVKKYHKVRKGETLTSVARKFGVTASDLKRWNHLKGTYLKPGRWLVYYKNETVNTTEGTQNNTEGNNEGNVEVKKEDPKPDEPVVAEIKNNPPAPKYTYYTVKSGDTLSKIAKMKGTTVDAIKAANKGSNLSMLRIGQKLKIPAKK